jgi:hypothetical protein
MIFNFYDKAGNLVASEEGTLEGAKNYASAGGFSFISADRAKAQEQNVQTNEDIASGKVAKQALSQEFPVLSKAFPYGAQGNGDAVVQGTQDFFSMPGRAVASLVGGPGMDVTQGELTQDQNSFAQNLLRDPSTGAMLMLGGIAAPMAASAYAPSIMASGITPLIPAALAAGAAEGIVGEYSRGLSEDPETQKFDPKITALNMLSGGVGGTISADLAQGAAKRMFPKAQAGAGKDIVADQMQGGAMGFNPEGYVADLSEKAVPYTKVLNNVVESADNKAVQVLNPNDLKGLFSMGSVEDAAGYGKYVENLTKDMGSSSGKLLPKSSKERLVGAPAMQGAPGLKGMLTEEQSGIAKAMFGDVEEVMSEELGSGMFNYQAVEQKIDRALSKYQSDIPTVKQQLTRAGYKEGTNAPALPLEKLSAALGDPAFETILKSAYLRPGTRMADLAVSKDHNMQRIWQQLDSRLKDMDVNAARAQAEVEKTKELVKAEIKKNSVELQGKARKGAEEELQKDVNIASGKKRLLGPSQQKKFDETVAGLPGLKTPEELYLKGKYTDPKLLGNLQKPMDSHYAAQGLGAPAAERPVSMSDLLLFGPRQIPKAFGAGPVGGARRMMGVGFRNRDDNQKK